MASSDRNSLSDTDNALMRAIVTGQLTERDRQNPAVVDGFGAHQKLDSLFRQLRDAPVIEDDSVDDDLPARIGDYEIRRRLGIGGFGSVYLGFDEKLQRQVAIKVPRQFLADPKEKERFQREARTAAALDHQHIASIYEVGEENGRPFIVSAYVDGVSLDKWVKTQQLRHEAVVRLIISIGSAIRCAHESGVVHRDIKPSNIMIDVTGKPVVMDFGLAKHLDEQSLSIDGKLLGTPAYMSPEQAKGESRTVDTAADIYSLGVVLYELLTGELPFRGTTQMVLGQVIHDDPPNPRKLRGDIPQDLETITLKCLAKEPHHRYLKVEELILDLTRWLDGSPISARPAGRVERTWRWAKRKPKLAALTLLVMLGLVLDSSLLAWALHEREGHENGIRREKARQAEQDSVDPILRDLKTMWPSLPSGIKKDIHRRAKQSLSRPSIAKPPSTKKSRTR